MKGLRRAVLALALAAPVLAGCGAGEPRFAGEAGDLRGVMLPRPLEKPDFTLTDTDGEPFEFRAETDGYLTLLFFGYTHCPDVCPVHLANLAAVIEGLPRPTRNRIRVVFVTVDPARDTPARIREWLDEFDPGFIGLRGGREAVDSIMRSLSLPTAVIAEPGADGDYPVGHATQIIAFTADDVARVVYPFGTRQADWAYDLPRLVEVKPASRVEVRPHAEPESFLGGDARRVGGGS